MKTFKLITALLCAGSLNAAAQHSKLKTNALMLGAGYTNMLDTYLSPEKYRGADLRIISHTRYERDSSAWVNQYVHEGNIAYADNRTNNGGEMAGGYTFRYTRLYRWNTSAAGRPLRLMAGAAVAANAGFIYNTRNGNNPANARLSLRIEPTVAVDMPLGRPRHVSGLTFQSPADCAHYPLVLHYEASAPLFGVMFSPNYGQSYYEIFSRGNYDHNCVPTTIGSTPSLRHMLTLDFRVLRATWRVGYLGTMEQSDVNSLKTHTYTHSIVIGLVKSIK